jgi:threonine dehydrogenase-like Zn-dependent dehydrogenase
MKALVANFSLGREVWDRFRSKIFSRGETSHAVSLDLLEIPEPATPGPEWVKIRSIMSGVSGPDETLLIHHDLSAFGTFLSFPFVPGNENLGIVTETGTAVEGIEPGERVIVNPVLSCRPREVEPACPSCVRGDPSACWNFGKGVVGPGMLIGACRDTGGGWGDSFVAHRSQVRVVPPHLESDHAILIPEFARGVRAILQHRPSPDDHVIIVGDRSLGCLTGLALRLVGHRAPVLMVAERPIPQEREGQFADMSVSLSDGAEVVYEAAAKFVDTTVRYPEAGRMALEGGADLVFETTGIPENVEHASRLTGPGKKLILMEINRSGSLDLSPLWVKGIRIYGTLFSGRDSYDQDLLETFDIALGLASTDNVSFSELISHKFQLHEHRQALDALQDRQSGGLTKVIFQHVM